MTDEEKDFLKNNYFNLHGIRTFTHIDRAWNQDNGEEISTDYIAIVSTDIKKEGYERSDTLFYEVYFSNEFSECGSGYCPATWGDLVGYKQVDKVLDVHYKPTLPSENMICRFLYETNNNDWSSFKSWKLELILKPGYPVLQSSGDGGDSYYPSGCSNFDMEFFEATERLPEKHRVYIFTGASGLGKSYLGNQLSEYLETDTLKELPVNLSISNIILGNKHGWNIGQIKELYEPFLDQIEFIEVKLSINE